MALLELVDVRAYYGPLEALHEISLEVAEGEAVSLLGANGAGKTTTLRAVSGTVRRTGRIVFDGRRIDRATPASIARLGIVHVPEGRGLFSELTVWENVVLGACVRRDAKAARRDCEDVFEHFPVLGTRRRQQAGTLSGGEQQMLALARALVARPRLLILDEPSLGLAPIVVRELFQIVQTLNAEQGVTVLVAEQNASVALKVTGRTYVLEVGRVALGGASDELSRDEGIRASYLGY
jgi:branched-chain amino acid transport system ATP-binding protein